MKFSILIGFLPWILLGAVPADVEIAVLVAFVTSVVVGYRDLRKGFILSWGTLIFFTFALFAVVVLKDPWVGSHTGVLSNGALAAIAWISLLIGRPFTQQYGRLEVDKGLWNNPLFIRVNRVLTAFWGCLFLLSMGSGIYNADHQLLESWMYQALMIAIFLIGMTVSIRYPRWAVKAHLRAKENASAVPEPVPREEVSE
jgi:uncharacterized membrane protein